MDTGLLLPASNQLIADLYSQPLSFVNEKIMEATKEAYPNLEDNHIFRNFLLREFVYYLNEGCKIFATEKVS